MTDVSVRDFAYGSLRAAVTGGFARRLAPIRRAGAAAPPLALLAEPVPAALAGRASCGSGEAVLSWLRDMPGHWRGRALARRDLAVTASDDAERREHLAMADLYDRMALSREAETMGLVPRAEFGRWRWRPFAATAIPADAEAGRRRRAHVEGGKSEAAKGETDAGRGRESGRRMAAIGAARRPVPRVVATAEGC